MKTYNYSQRIYSHTRTNRSYTYVYECVHCTIRISISNLICRKRLKSQNNNCGSSSSNNHNRIHSQTWRHVITLRLAHIHTHAHHSQQSRVNTIQTHILSHGIQLNRGPCVNAFIVLLCLRRMKTLKEKFWYDSVSIASAARSKQRNKIKRNTYTRTHTCDCLVSAQWFNSFRLPQPNELAVRVLVQFQFISRLVMQTS